MYAAWVVYVFMQFVQMLCMLTGASTKELPQHCRVTGSWLGLATSQAINTCATTSASAWGICCTCLAIVAMGSAFVKVHPSGVLDLCLYKLKVVDHLVNSLHDSLQVLHGYACNQL